MLLVSITATMTGCASSGRLAGDSVALAPVPADLKVCFARLVPPPPPGPLTRKQVIRLIGELKTSELAKSRCGKRLIVWYETQARILAK
jgi:hypothetical protein